MIEFKRLEEKYRTDAVFNRMVNVFQSLLEEYEVMPVEIREALFYAQWKFHIYNPKMVLQTERDWQDIEKAREMLLMHFNSVEKKDGK